MREKLPSGNLWLRNKRVHIIKKLRVQHKVHDVHREYIALSCLIALRVLENDQEEVEELSVPSVSLDQLKIKGDLFIFVNVLGKLRVIVEDLVYELNLVKVVSLIVAYLGDHLMVHQLLVFEGVFAEKEIDLQNLIKHLQNLFSQVLLVLLEARLSFLEAENRPVVVDYHHARVHQLKYALEPANVLKNLLLNLHALVVALILCEDVDDLLNEPQILVEVDLVSPVELLGSVEL